MKLITTNNFSLRLFRKLLLRQYVTTSEAQTVLPVQNAQQGPEHAEKEKKFCLPKRFCIQKPENWNEYYDLAKDNNSNINLGFSDPDLGCVPSNLPTNLAKVALCNKKFHMYTRNTGHIRLVKALAKFYSWTFKRHVDPLKEILVTAGNTEGIFCALSGHTEYCDEFILLEPYCEAYAHIIRSCGGIPRCIPLIPKPCNLNGLLYSSDWYFDKEALSCMFNDRTKAIVLSSPHNPIGKVFSLDELELIASLCKKHNTLCIMDETYEHFVYCKNKHIRMACLPDMWDRTITILSGGKTYGATGWRLGWVIAPNHLLDNLRAIHNFTTYSASTPAQEAISDFIEEEYNNRGCPKTFYTDLRDTFQNRRDFMAQFLIDSGFTPTIPDGGHYIVCDWSPIERMFDLSAEIGDHKDQRLSKWLIKNLNILVTPMTPFYSVQHRHIAETYLRLCFTGEEDKLQEAASIFNAWSRNL